MKSIVSFLLLAFSFSLFGQQNAKLPFIANKGQWNSAVNYRMPVGTGSVFLENQRFTFVQYSVADLDAHHELKHDNEFDAARRFPIHGHAWRATFVGANENPLTKGTDVRGEYHNYFIGNDPAKWASKVPLYNGVTYANLYPEIDLNVYSANNHFKYDFIVHPGASAATIQMLYSGTEGMRIEDGNLVTQTSVGAFTEKAPVAYQVINGQKIPVACAFTLTDNTVGFSFPEGYDKAHDLIIDPELVGASLSGSTSTNYGHCATYDNDENIYTGAISFGTGYPTEEGSFQTAFGGGGTDIAISKLNQDATAMIYATYLGGSGSEYPHSLVVNDDNEIYVFGTSQSIDYPTSATAFDSSGPDGGISPDIVVTHLNIDGTDIVGSTFVGGDASDGRNTLTSNYGDSYRGEIIVDGDGNCYIASCSQSEDFPTTAGAYQETYGGGAQDAVVFSLNPDLSTMNWSTYMGDTFGEGALGLRLDSDENLYVCGTATGEFITGTGYQTTYQGGSRDAYVVRLTDNGSTITSSSYWGTPNGDAAFFLDLDNDGNVFLYGQSDGGASEVTAGVYSNAGSNQFICKLSPDLATLGLGTVVGNGGSDFVPIAFMVDACGYIYFSGHNASGTLPLTDDALYETGGFYLGVLQPEAVDLEFATKYSGNHVDGGTSRFDPNTGIVYQAVCISGGFTTTPGAWATTSPSWDVGVFKIDFGISHVNAAAEASPDATGCAPFEVTFENESTGLSYEWNFGDGSPATTEEAPTHTFTDPGVYDVRLVAFDPDGCLTSDTAYVTITVGAGVTPTASFVYDFDCATGEVTVTSTGTPDVPLVWNMGDGTTYTDVSELVHNYSGTGTFTITLTAGDGVCAETAVATEDVLIGEAAVDILFNVPTCYQFSDGSVTVDILSPTGSEIIEITDVDGNILNVGGSNTANTLSSGWYYYHVDLGDGCELTDSVFLSDPPQLNAQLNLTEPLCNGNETGVVIVDTVFYWQGLYNSISYIWAPDPNGISGLGADTITNLGVGNYTLTINDGNGCSRVFDFVINQPDPLEFVEFGKEPAYCRLYGYQSGNGVVYAAAVGGTPHYDYLWTNNETGAITDNSTWGGLNPGSYTVLVTDANGCTLTETIQLDSLNPIAKFDVVSDDLNADCQGTAPVEVKFINQSENFADPKDPNADTTFYWNLNYDNIAWVITHDYLFAPDTTITDGGTYPVCLVAQNKNGCVDTTCKDIVVYDPLVFQPINIFTPDGDQINDVFTFVQRADAVAEFYCIVLNRWGITIAEFNSIDEGWDGTDSQGNAVPDGVYFYNYSGKAENSTEFSGQGTVQVVNSKK